MMIEVMPWSFSSRIRSRSLPLSSSFSAAVGSSRMSSFTFFDSALAISTSCCLPTPMSATRVCGCSSRPTRRSSSAACRSVSFQLMTPRVACSLPRKMFSAIDRYGHQGQFLVDDHDAALLAGPDVLELAGLALEEDLALVAAVRVDAGEHLHQGRLAGAVLTADGVDLARADGQV